MSSSKGRALPVASVGAAAGVAGAGFKIPAFLNKLYSMVDEPSTESLIHWSSSGNSFFIPSAEPLGKELFPRFFKHSNFSSFISQLNMYGFRKIGLLQIAGASPSNFLVRQIDFVWVVRHSSHLTWFRPQLEAALSETTLPDSLVVNLKFFVTSPTTMASEVSSLSEEYESISEDAEVLEKPKPSSSKSPSEEGPFETGRPDLSLMLSEIANESVGLSLAVGVCGPLAMIDDVEDKLAEVQLRILKGKEGCSEMMGKVERFGW